MEFVAANVDLSFRAKIVGMLQSGQVILPGAAVYLMDIESYFKVAASFFLRMCYTVSLIVRAALTPVGAVSYDPRRQLDKSLVNRSKRRVISVRQIWFAFLIALSFIMMGCGSSQIDPAATEVAAVTQTTTAQTAAAPTATATAAPTATPTATPIPTDTATPTLTPMPTATETPSPTPTPMGGGNGVVIFSINPWRGKPESDIDGVWSIQSDGSQLTQILSRTRLEEILGDYYDWFASYQVNNNQGFLMTLNGLHAVTEDWQITRSINTGDLYFESFSPDGNLILLRSSSGTLGFQPINGEDPVVISAGFDGRDIGFSADGSKVYYTRRDGRDQWMANIDGTGIKPLNLEAFGAYTPSEDRPLGRGGASRQYTPNLDSFSASPDQSLMALNWKDLLFVTDAEDSEITSPRLVSRLPHFHTDDELANSMDWSLRGDAIYWNPEGTHVAVILAESIDNGNLTVTDDYVTLVRISDGVAVSTAPLNRGDEVCGFTPDGAHLLVTDYEGIYLVSFDDGMRKKVVDLSEAVGLDSNNQWTNCYHIIME